MLFQACAYCDHPNPISTSSCQACGSALHLQPCRQCGVVSLARARTCPGCQTPFPERPVFDVPFPLPAATVARRPVRRIEADVAPRRPSPSASPLPGESLHGEPLGGASQAGAPFPINPGAGARAAADGPTGATSAGTASLPAEALPLGLPNPAAAHFTRRLIENAAHQTIIDVDVEDPGRPGPVNDYRSVIASPASPSQQDILQAQARVKVATRYTASWHPPFQPGEGPATTAAGPAAAVPGRSRRGATRGRGARGRPAAAAASGSGGRRLARGWLLAGLAALAATAWLAAAGHLPWLPSSAGGASTEGAMAEGGKAGSPAAVPAGPASPVSKARPLPAAPMTSVTAPAAEAGSALAPTEPPGPSAATLPPAAAVSTPEDRADGCLPSLRALALCDPPRRTPDSRP